MIKIRSARAGKEKRQQEKKEYASFSIHFVLELIIFRQVRGFVNNRLLFIFAIAYF
jgi:hypothetical protein